MGLTKTQGHRPSALKQQNKPHKHGRHKSKRVLENENKGKVSVKSLTKRTKKLLGKEERRNQAGQLRKKKRDEVLQKKRALGGAKTAPFLVAVVPLSPEISSQAALEMIQRADAEAIVTNSPSGVIHISVPRFKQRFSFLEVKAGDIYATLDALKVADTVLFLETARHWEEGLYPEAELLLTTSMAQGMPSSVVAIMDLESVSKKKQQEAKMSIQKEICQYLPEEKVMTLSTDSDSLLLLRRIGGQKQKSVLQRDRRPHLMAEEIQSVPETEAGGFTSIRISGYLRGQNLSANQLVHIPGWGTFQIQQIEMPTQDPHPMELRKKDGIEIGEDIKILEIAHPQNQESLDSENIPDPMDAEQTWPTEEEIAEAEMERKAKKKIKRVPKGFSDYQAAWIPDCDAEEVSEDEGESEYDDAMEDPAMDAMSVEDSNPSSNEDDDAEEDYDTVTVTEGAPDADRYDAEMDMHEELETLKQLKDAKTDAQFPDEIDTPHDIPARVRFQKYRGLQSFRTSAWDPKENLPSDYARIFQFENFDRTRKRVLAKLDEGSGAMPGWYITLVIINVPKDLVLSQKCGYPIVVYGLLPHEQKMSVLNFALKRPAQMSFGLQTPIKSKEQLVFQCGFRRFKACPVFSQHTNGTKHKFERFFQPDAVVVATVFAPITFPPCSVLAFKERKDGTQLVATGSLLSVNPDRIVAKRVALSGHPFKVNKKSAVIRFMFFNREDINWFKPVELHTRYGRRGHIKEPLGTHGHMKCVFDGQLKSQDTVMLNLYKRVFPKWTYDPCVSPPDPLFKQMLSSIAEEDEEMIS